MKKRKIINPKNIYFKSSVKFDVKLSFEENLSAIYKANPLKMKFLIFISVIGLINYFLPLLNNELFIETKEYINIFSFDYFLDNIPFLSISIFPFIYYYTLKKQIKNGVAIKGIEYIFDKDLLTVITETTKAEINLDSIKKILITDRLIMIFTSKNSASVIPKRVFDNEKELNEFINQFKR